MKEPSSDSILPFCAPASKATPTELQQAIETITRHPVMTAVLRAFSGVALVLNDRRQIVAANLDGGELLRSTDLAEVIGLRPGEAFSCSHIKKGKSGCQGSPACGNCGIHLALIGSRVSEAPVEKEFLLTTNLNGLSVSIEFQARAVTFRLEDQLFTIITLQDISEKKRCEALERIFFHDVLNTISALRNFAELLCRVDLSKAAHLVEKIGLLSKRLMHEVQDQRAMSEMESDGYEPSFEEVALERVMNEVRQTYLDHDLAKGKMLVVQSGAETARPVRTDFTLVVRVLVNMVKNALEATTENREVRVWVEETSTAVAFKVSNQERISREVAVRIFRRHFSTKPEKGRGLGTFSMKLLGEKYLGGSVAFDTGAKGTVFSLTLPRLS